LFLGCIVQERSAVRVHCFAQEPLGGPLSQRSVVVEIADDLSAKRPEVVDVLVVDHALQVPHGKLSVSGGAEERAPVGRKQLPEKWAYR
jgi:hypothetical protein